MVTQSSALLSMFVQPVIHSLDHLVKRNIEYFGDFPQPDCCGIQNAPFDAADVGPVEAAPCRQLFLGYARLAATIGNSRADCSLFEAGGLYLASSPLHPETSWWYVEAHKPTAYTPHSMSDICRQSMKSAVGVRRTRAILRR